MKRPALFDPLVARIHRAARAFDARSRRERLLLIGATMALAAVLADQAWLTPAFETWKTARTQLATTRAEAARIEADLASQAAAAQALEQQLRGEVIDWRQRVQQGDEALQRFGTTLVSAADMPAMLERLLTQNGLKLRSMQSLGRSEVSTAPPGTAPAPAGSALYRHGVELSVEGSWADLLAYLQALEALPQRVLWGGLQLEVEQHPKTLMTLRLYTLSLDRRWLEL